MTVYDDASFLCCLFLEGALHSAGVGGTVKYGLQFSDC